MPKAAAPQAAPAAAPRATRAKPTARQGQPQLFEPSDLPSPAPSASPPPDAWIGALLGSPIYVAQRQLAARVAPPDDQMQLLLTALSERGGKLSRAALAHRLSLPEVRIGGLLSAVRRLLNVDQASVLTVDEAAGTIELNLALLHQQFRLPGQGDQR